MQSSGVDDEKGPMPCRQCDVPTLARDIMCSEECRLRARVSTLEDALAEAQIYEERAKHWAVQSQDWRRRAEKFDEERVAAVRHAAMLTKLHAAERHRAEDAEARAVAAEAEVSMLRVRFAEELIPR